MTSDMDLLPILGFFTQHPAHALGAVALFVVHSLGLAFLRRGRNVTGAARHARDQE